MSNDEPATGFGSRPELPPRPPVPDDRIHGDTLDPNVKGWWPESVSAARPPAPPTLAPPAPPAPGALPPTSRRGRRRWVVFGVGAALLVGGVNVGRAGGSVEEHATLSHAVTGIRLNSDAGDVEVSGGAPAGTVELTRRVLGGSDSPSSNADERWEGDTLVISSGSSCVPLGFGCSVDYTLRVPDGTAVTIDAGSGDLKLGGTLGAVDVKAGSGDIKAKGLRSTTLATRSGRGDIDLALAQAPTQLTVKTGSGDINVKVPPDDTYAVGVQTGSGDEAVSVKTDRNSPHKAQIQTGSGDVEFGYR